MSINDSRMCQRSDAKEMKRPDLMQRLLRKLNKEEAVIGGIGHTNHDLWTAGQRPQNFYMLGSMGLAVPIALGVSLAQPKRKVFALEGDGSLLMQLGSLGTVAAAKVNNLTIVVFDNGSYNITGGQKTLTSHGTDLVAIARACGLNDAVWAADEENFEALIEKALAQSGPRLIATRVDRSPAAGVSEFNSTKIRDVFMRGMGTTA